MNYQWKILLIVILAAAGIYYWYYGRELASPKRELLRLRLSLLCLFGFVFVAFVAEPTFAYYIDTSPTQIQTIDDARLAIQRSNETMAKMANDLRESAWMTSMFLVFLAAWVLPSFLRVSELILGEKDELNGEDKLISIIEDDKQ